MKLTPLYIAFFLCFLVSSCSSKVEDPGSPKEPEPGDPIIASVSEDLAEGSIITLTGEEFGTHAGIDEIWFLGGKDGWIESTADGTDPVKAPSTIRLYTAQGQGDEVTSASSWSGSKSINLRNDPANLESWASTWAYKKPGGFRKLYVSFWYYMDVEYMPENTPQHKFVTVSSDTHDGCSDWADALHSNNMVFYWNYRIDSAFDFDMITTLGNYTLLGCENADVPFTDAKAIGYSKQDDPYWWDRLTRGATSEIGEAAKRYHFEFGAWNRVDIWLDLGTWDNADGYLRVKVVKPSGPHEGQQIGAEYKNVLYLSNVGDCLRCFPASEKDVFVWYNLFHNTAEGDPPVSNHYVDDPYIQVGTQARIEMGNNAVYEDSSKLEIQNPTSWKDGKITFKLNYGGSFSSGDTVYLFVINDPGKVSPGVAIQLPRFGPKSLKTCHFLCKICYPKCIQIRDPFAGQREHIIYKHL